MKRLALVTTLLLGGYNTLAQDDQQRQEVLNVYKSAQALMAHQWDELHPCGWVIAYKQGVSTAKYLATKKQTEVDPAKFRIYQASVKINLVKSLNTMIRSGKTFSEGCPLEIHENDWTSLGMLVLSKTYQIVELIEDILRDQPSAKELVSINLADEWKASVKASAAELAKECEGGNQRSFGLDTPCNTLQRALNRGMTPDDLNLTPKGVAKLLKKNK